MRILSEKLSDKQEYHRTTNINDQRSLMPPTCTSDSEPCYIPDYMCMQHRNIHKNYVISYMHTCMHTRAHKNTPEVEGPLVSKGLGQPSGRSTLATSDGGSVSGKRHLLHKFPSLQQATCLVPG